MAYNFAPLQKKVLPTLEEALKAYSKAVDPNDKSRDVRPLLAIEEALPEADPRLAGHISHRTAQLAGFPWRIKPRTPADQEKALQVESRLKAAIDDLGERSLDSYLFGHSLARTRWTLDGLWVPTTEHFYDASDLEPMADATAFPGRIALLSDEGGSVQRMPATAGIDGDTRVSYIASRRGKKVGGIMRSIMFYQVLLHINLQDWAGFNKRIKGLAVTKYRTGGDPADIAAAKSAAEQIGSAAGVAISEDVAFEFVKMVDAIGKDSYESFMERIDARIEIAMRGQANTAELPSGGGSRAALQVSKLSEDDGLFWDIMNFKRIINRQLLRQDYEYNVAAIVPSILPYEFEFITDEVEDYEKNARIIQSLGMAGYRADDEEVQRKTGLTTVKYVGQDTGGF